MDKQATRDYKYKGPDGTEIAVSRGIMRKFLKKQPKRNYKIEKRKIKLEKYKAKMMNKQALLEDVYNSAFEDELEKIALSRKTMISAAEKAQKYVSYPKGRGPSNMESKSRSALKNLIQHGNLVKNRLKGKAPLPKMAG